jgi:hypothetical protein
VNQPMRDMLLAVAREWSREQRRKVQLAFPGEDLVIFTAGIPETITRRQDGEEARESVQRPD